MTWGSKAIGNTFAMLALACVAWLAVTPKAEALTITSVSGSTMYIDVEMQAANSLLGAYEGYRITTGPGESYSDLWVTSSSFGATITLAPNEDGIRHLGPIAANSSVYVYFYLTASAEVVVAQSHNIRVYNGGTSGTLLSTLPVSMTASERGSTNNNKITVVTHTPSGPGIGGTLVMTIQGETGTMTNENPNVFLTPASETDWPANVFELEHVTSTFNYSAMLGGALVTDHLLTFATNQTVNVPYTVVYTFRIVGLKSTPTTVQPVNYLSSGGQMKHTSIDSNDYTGAIMLAGTIPQPQLHMQLSRSPQSPTEGKVPGYGSTLTHRLRVTSSFGSQAIVFDDFTDVFQSLPGTPTYVAGSGVVTMVNSSGTVTGTRAAIAPLITTGGGISTWKFTDYFSIPAGGYLELSYSVNYPPGSARYEQRATAHVGTTQIDTTKPATVTTAPDNAPAIVFVSVGDADLDGVYDVSDVDADNDGISDLVESGLAADPDADADSDGVQNYRDASFVTCTDAVAPIGTCDALAASLDVDGDGIANHLDLDSDGDGITDAYEAESGDANGDGRPDGCTTVNGSGQCASGLIANPRDTDGAGGDDYLDADSDGDGITDFNESRDSTGDGVADVTFTAADADSDGIKDRFDPSCTMAAPCTGSVIGSPILAVLAAYQDQNGDGAPDWLQGCGDAYTTSGEACDDGDLDNSDVCNNMCLLGLGQVCTAGTQCGSTRCDSGLGTCQSCIDSAASGTDSGCTAMAPTCTTTGSTNSCVVCNDSGGATDDGCTAGAPFCNESANGGLGACAQCVTASDCDDGNACTTNACSSGTCSFPPVGAGAACTGGVCDGGSVCVTCIDNAAAGATDSGCSAALPACNPSANGGAGACVECAGPADCGDSNTCTQDLCMSGTCSNPPESAGTSCAGGVCDGTAAAECVDCVDDGDCGSGVCAAEACVACENDQAGLATDHGCSVASPLCDTSGAAPICVECLAASDCDDSNPCTTDSCGSGTCSNTTRPEGAACTGGVCDGAAMPACVTCVDNAAAGATDSGCSGATPACNESANGGAGACVQCAGAVDCGDSNACTQDVCTAGACSNPAQTAGTLCTGGVCDGDGTPACVTCIDNAATGATDAGCSGATPACNAAANGGAGACVACIADGDCGSGSVCDANACVTCENDQTGLATDHGCSAAAPLCDTSGASPICVECIGVGDCDDSNECTTDSCSGSGACVNTVRSEGAACTGGVCDGAATPVCVTCVDNAAAGATDSGCSGATPACNESANGGAGACVECAGTADCGDGNACTEDVCTSGSCSNPAETAGTLCTSGVCDGDATPACVTCIDNAATGATDAGCSGATPACNAAANGGAGACLACIADGDCGSGSVCDANACVTCENDQAGLATDHGCSAASPLCDTSGASPVCVECIGAGDCDDSNECTTDVCGGAGACSHAPRSEGAACTGGVCDGDATPACVTCVDNAAAGATDSGCSGATPACDASASGGDGACVQCEGAADCGDSNACTEDVCTSGACSNPPEPEGTVCTGGVCDGDGTPACVNCVDDQPAGSDDSGCSDTTPACDASAAGGLGACVTCIADGDCGSGVCVAQACVACEDDQTGDATDHGCSAASPLCDTSGAANACVECLGNGDCDVGEICNPSGTCAPGCADDDDCTVTPGTPLCDTTAQACVECLAVDDCEDGNECTSDACTSGACMNDEEPVGTLCTGGVCDGAETTPACVTCVDSAGDGATDTGCSAIAPACDASAAGGLGACVECEGLAHCVDGNACTADVCSNGVCDNDPEPSGTTCTGGVCDGASTPACVACVDDGDCGSGVCAANVCVACEDDETGLATDHGCDMTTPLCDTSGAAPVCVGCIGAGDCDDSNECTEDACSAGVCANTPATEGDACTGGVCDGASAPSCATCVDNAASGSTDSGCTAVTPSCDETAAGGAGACVACLADADCGAAGVCVAQACVACEDDQAGIATDHGCGGTSPLCDTSGAAAVCVECLGDTDCDVGAICNPAGACAPGCSDDDDCTGSAATPVCDTSAQVCVACLGDGACDDSDACTADSCDSGGCVNDPEPLGTDCSSGGICDGEAAPSCVACVDDEPAGGEDTGCSSAAPACDASANGGLGACVACAVDGDCGSGVCAAQACVACEDDQAGADIDHGCDGASPLCDMSGAASACVECLGDSDCDSGEVCSPTGTCTVGCMDDDDCAGVTGAPVCETGSQTCVECVGDDDCDGASICNPDYTCGAPDSDDDSVTDDVDLDDDNDGVSDALELGGDDPVDTDSDGVSNHLDRDSDGDGLTDALESSAGDDDGDGVPDDCVPVTASGECGGGSVATPVNTDVTGDPDFLDLDSDGDGLSDAIEAFDDDGDGAADVDPAGSDTDGDGIDDAFDGDCALSTDCNAIIGAPVEAGFEPWQDENGDDQADWQQTCGDAYLTGDEPCDDANLTDGDACSNACLLGLEEVCTGGEDCDSGLCDGELATCQGCVDDAASGTDSGCEADAPTCVTAGNASTCSVCADGSEGTDDGCSAGTPACDVTADGGLGACFACLSDDDCDTGELCSSGRACEPIAPSGCQSDDDCLGNTVCVALTGACEFGDHDSDGVPDDADLDDDGDGIADDVEIGRDAGEDDDMDGILDFEDADFADCSDRADTDGVCDALPVALDRDEDGVANHLDEDADDDGVADANEGYDDDFDGDADRDAAGSDTDGDGLDDAYDADCDSAAVCGGVVGVPSTEPDLDDDGEPNYLDPDDDGDQRSTADEREDAEEYEGPADDAEDIDGDGQPNWLDTDADGDGASDELENQKADADDNGIRDALDPLFRSPDEDEDGLLDVVECPPPAYPADDNCPDTDGDGTPDYQDEDSDDDGLSDADELEHGTDPLVPDTDGDGLEDGEEVHEHETDPNVVDTDGDGLEDGEEVDEHGTDPNVVDTDGDGVDDGQEVEDDTDPLKPPAEYSLQGGALFGCSTTTHADNGGAWPWLALSALALAYRRRRTSRSTQR